MGQTTSVPAKPGKQIFRLFAEGGCGFDCPNAQCTFKVVDGSGGVLPAAQPGLDKLNAVPRPGGWLQFIPILIGVVVMAVGAVLEGVGVLGILIMAFGSNLAQQYEADKFIRLLREACPPGWEIVTKFRCDHDASCKNGYRQFCGRKDLYAEFDIAAGGGGGQMMGMGQPQMMVGAPVMAVPVQMATPVMATPVISAEPAAGRG